MGQIRVGIDIGGSKMLLVAQGDGIEERQYFPTGKDLLPEDTCLIISQWIEKLPSAPKSIGIAIPGLVSEEGKVVACDVLPKIAGWFPAVEFERICPVRVLNDAEAALYEASAHKNSQNVVVITIGTGIGAAFLINGQFLRGAQGWAGELGSIPISATSTLDGQASGAAILQLLGVSSDRLAALVARGDVTALAAIKQAGSALGLGIATVINLLNPELIVLAGGTCRWLGYVEAALKSAEYLSLPDLWAGCTIEPRVDAGDIVALGAMRAAMRIES